LLLAGRLKVREDRLTDYVAVCAERNVEFARGLFALAGLDHPVATVRALTQTWTPRGRRVDFELIGLDGHHRELCRLWGEHKTGASYQPLQLEDYEEDLRAWEDARLLTVVEHPGDAPSGAWQAATWADVAALAVGLLRERYGRAWRAQAWSPTAKAKDLVLAELLEYLEKEHRTVSDPLTTTDLMAIQHAPGAYNALESLLERSGELTGKPVAGRVGWSDDWDAGWLVIEEPNGWWTSYGGSAEIHAASADTYFGATRRGEPAIGVGANVSPEYGETIYRTHADWVTAVREAGFDPFPDDDWVRFYRTIYLAEVVAAGVTLEEQANFVAGRAKQALLDLASLAPPTPLEKPPSRARRSRTSTEELPPAAGDA
jgi:hypothetical protein